MKLIKYIKETKSEMKHVSWPTQKQAIAYTLLVVIISAFVASYIGLLDFGFTELIDKFLV